MQLEVNITGKSFENAAGKRHDVLDNVTFTLNAGEVGVLFGPSGCGKSTLLRILAGLDANYRGHVTRLTSACGLAWCSRSRGCCPGARSRRTSGSPHPTSTTARCRRCSRCSN